MKNMDKGVTVPKWVLIAWAKIPQIYLPNLSAQDQNFWISMKKCFIERPYSVVVVVCLYAFSDSQKLRQQNIQEFCLVSPYQKIKCQIILPGNCKGWTTKGQKISKANHLALNSSKKQTKIFYLLRFMFYLLDKLKPKTKN